jgi:hypothetical protein
VWIGSKLLPHLFTASANSGSDSDLLICLLTTRANCEACRKEQCEHGGPEQQVLHQQQSLLITTLHLHLTTWEPEYTSFAAK